MNFCFCLNKRIIFVYFWNLFYFIFDYPPQTKVDLINERMCTLFVHKRGKLFSLIKIIRMRHENNLSEWSFVCERERESIWATLHWCYTGRSLACSFVKSKRDVLTNCHARTPTHHPTTTFTITCFVTCCVTCCWLFE